jgi:hypothetical protein
MTSPDPATIGVLSTAIAGMTTAISILWKHVSNNFIALNEKLDRSEQRLIDCESDRLAIWTKHRWLLGQEKSSH